MYQNDGRCNGHLGNTDHLRTISRADHKKTLWILLRKSNFSRPDSLRARKISEIVWTGKIPMNIFSESTYSFLNFFEIRKEKFKNSQFLVLFSRLLASILSGAVLFHQMVISQSKTYMKLNGWLREKFGRGKLSLRVQNL